MTRPFILDGTMGAMFVGVVVANSLHGISLCQAYYYFRNQNDKWPIFSLVTAVMFCDTIHQLLITHTVYIYVISNWGNAVELGTLVWSLAVENFFNAMTAFLVQSFMLMRVWRLSDRNIWLTAVLTVFVLAEFVTVNVFTILELQFQTFDQLRTLEPLSLAVNILSVVGDVLIAVTLCFLLLRSRTGFRRSDTIITKLVVFTINTGLLTSLCALASFISYKVAPQTLIYVGFYFCIGRLYSNALLATLNARKIIRDCPGNIFIDPTNEMSLSSSEFSKNRSSLRPHGKIPIRINTTQECVTDLSQDVDKMKYFQPSSSNGAISTMVLEEKTSVNV